MHRENRFSGGQDRRSFAPVQVGDEIEVKIEAVGEKGDGIAKIKGFVIFIPNVKQGENVKVKITKVLRKVGFGEVVGASSGAHKESHKSRDSEDNMDSEESSSEDNMDSDNSNSEDSEEFGEDEAEEEY